MTKTLLPYGSDYKEIDIPDQHLIGIIKAKEYRQPMSPDELIIDAIEHPLGTDILRNIAHAGDRVAIVVDDYTRPCPTKRLLPPLLEELRKAGVDDNDVIILIATGTHAPPDEERIQTIVGDKIMRNYTIISNTDEGREFLCIGTSKNNNDIKILREYIEADIKILTGDIEYHYFAGYGGTRKSILPGIASNDTIQRNHILMFHQGSDIGQLKGNILSEEMTEALHMAGCDYCINVVINSYHHIVGCWSGEPHLILAEGTRLIDSMYRQDIETKADITMISANGAPHDINLYQATKALYNATCATKKGGSIILLAECPDGMGHDIYEEWLRRYKTAEETESALKEHFIIGAHKAYYHRSAIEGYQVILVSELEDGLVKDLLGMIPAEDIDQAYEIAMKKQGKEAKVLIVPQGSTTRLVCGAKGCAKRG